MNLILYVRYFATRFIWKHFFYITCLLERSSKIIHHFWRLSFQLVSDYLVFRIKFDFDVLNVTFFSFQSIMIKVHFQKMKTTNKTK